MDAIRKSDASERPGEDSSQPQDGKKDKDKPPERPGYRLDGFCKSFRHPKTKKMVKAPPGKAFPLWRKIV